MIFEQPCSGHGEIAGSDAAELSFTCLLSGVYELARRQDWEKRHGYLKNLSTSHRENSRDLCTASYDRGRSAFRSHHDSTAGARWAWAAESSTRPSYSRCVRATFRTAGLCGLLGLWLQGEDVTPAYQQPARLEQG
jgi:hypothetical protein